MLMDKINTLYGKEQDKNKTSRDSVFHCLYDCVIYGQASATNSVVFIEHENRIRRLLKESGYLQRQHRRRDVFS